MHRFFILMTLLILTATGGFLWYALTYFNESEWAQWSQENGPIEMASVVLFGVAALVGFLRFVATRAKTDFIFCALMAAAAAREMDWHKEWTTDSILKSKFYLSPETPGHEKIIGAVFIAFLIYAAFQMVKRVPYFVTQLWAFAANAWALALGICSLVIAKTLDSMARLFPFMAEFHADNRDFLGVIEETLELTGAAFFVVFALIIFKRVSV